MAKSLTLQLLTGFVYGVLFMILAGCGGGGGSTSNPPVAVPVAPTGVTASAGNGQVIVSWSAVAGATSYNVYHRTSSGVTTANGTKLSGLTSGSAVSGLVNGTISYFVVTAVNNSGESLPSSQVSATPLNSVPAAPTGVAASAGDGLVVLSWTAVNGATSYNVYYGTSPGLTTTSGTKLVGITSGSTISSQVNGTACYFLVTAVNSIGESPASSQVSATPQATIPAAPGGVNISAGNAQVTLGWTAVSGATSYNVYYATSSGVSTASGTKLAGISAGSTISSLTNGATYYFIVTAVNAGSESPPSSQVSATPQIPAPAAPSGVSAVPGDARATVSWTAVAGASSYNVYYRASAGVTTTNGTKLSGLLSGSAVTGLTNGTTCYFIVTAVNAGGESAPSPEVSATLTLSAALVRDISAGWGHAMVLKSNGSVWAWGGSDYGQLGNSNASYRSANPLPLQSGIDTVSMISAGNNDSVSVKSDGTIWAWGNNAWNKLGNTAGDTTTPVVVSGFTNPLAISAGFDHTVILRSDGTVWGMGKNNDGRLGNGEQLGNGMPSQITGHATPVQMLGPGGVGFMNNVINVATGSSNTAVIRNDGTVWTCGWNQNMQLGGGSGPDSSIPVQVAGLTGIVDVAVSDYRMYALKSDGTVWSWGLVVSDMWPYNGSTSTATPVQVSGLSNVVAISSHTSHALALKRDGTVWSWGQNISGKLGNNTLNDSATPVQVVGPGGSGYLTGITAIDTGWDYSMALKNDGSVWTWGENSSGTLGNGSTTNSSVPVQVSGLTTSNLLAPSNLTATAASGSASYNIYRSTIRGGAVALLGSSVSAGYNDATAVNGTTYYYSVTAVAGSEESTPSNKVAVIPGGAAVSALKMVGGGFYHSAAVGNDGSIWSWGSNNFGELGNGATSDSSTPAKLTSINGVSAVTGGNDHTVALKSDGTVWAWGYNYHGELGNGTKTGNSANSAPGQVMTAAATPLTGITSVRGGFWHTLALKNDGTVWGWGNNDYGQLGNGTVTPQYGGIAYAGQVTGLSNVVAIAAGHWHSVAVKSDGSVWTWGYNGGLYADINGQLGDGTTISRSTPVQVLGPGGVGKLSGITSVAAGAAFTLALKNDGTVWGWGRNMEGEFGNGTLTNSLTPVQAANGVNNITSIAAGYWLSLALKSDGTVWAWGQNDLGQLGNGTTTNNPTPAAVSGLTSVSYIHAGASFGLALKNDGTVWGWGDNSAGQLGNGGITNSSTPVKSQGGGL